MKYKKHKKFKATKRQAIVFILIISMFIGICAGATAALSMSGTSYTMVTQNLADYLRSFNTLGENSNKMDILRESTVKYFKIFAIIWLLAFLPTGGKLPIGGFIATLLVGFRGTAYGFATATLIRNYGTAGSICASILYLPQSLVLIPAYIFTAYSCVDFVLREKTGVNKYVLVLIIGFAVSMLVGFIDAFIVPGLVRNLL